MMNFRVIGDAIKRTLAAQASGEFRVIGSPKAGKGDDTVLDRSRLVEVFYLRGSFPKNKGGLFGPTQHEITYRVDMTVSAAAKANLALIESGDASAEQMANAIADMKESGALADASMDELFESVYQIIMDARNADFGLGAGVVSSRWLSDLSKDEPIKSGQYTVLTGSAVLTCSAAEQVTGYRGVTISDPVFDVGLMLDTDSAGKSGVQVGGE